MSAICGPCRACIERDQVRTDLASAVRDRDNADKVRVAEQVRAAQLRTEVSALRRLVREGIYWAEAETVSMEEADRFEGYIARARAALAEGAGE